MLELVGNIASELITVWVVISFLKSISNSQIFKTIINETLYVFPVLVVAWYLIEGDPSEWWHMVRLVLAAWIWYDEYTKRDDRWKKRRKRLVEKVKEVSPGKLAIVPEAS